MQLEAYSEGAEGSDSATEGARFGIGGLWEISPVVVTAMLCP